MSILVAADIHGSVPAANFILAVAQKIRPTAILLLGDILYHGSRNPLPIGYDPKSVVNILAPLAKDIIAVRGNCDSDVDCALLPFPVASDFAWIMLHQLRIFATHGHIYNPQNMPPLREHDIFIYAHTHTPAAHDSSGITICNPGSLSLPKENHPATYGLFAHGAFSVVTMDEEVYLKITL